MSPRLELLRPELPGAEDLEERTNRALLLVGTSGSRAPLTARDGLEEGAYLMGDESVTFSDPSFEGERYEHTARWGSRSTARN